MQVVPRNQSVLSLLNWGFWMSDYAIDGPDPAKQFDLQDFNIIPCPKWRKILRLVLPLRMPELMADAFQKLGFERVGRTQWIQRSKSVVTMTSARYTRFTSLALVSLGW